MDNLVLVLEPEENTKNDADDVRSSGGLISQ